jgi:hypothetical protein
VQLDEVGKISAQIGDGQRRSGELGEQFLSAKGREGGGATEGQHDGKLETLPKPSGPVKEGGAGAENFACAASRRTPGTRRALFPSCVRCNRVE